MHLSPALAVPAVPAASLFETLARSAAENPIDLAATVIFALALLHIFLAPRILAYADRQSGSEETDPGGLHERDAASEAATTRSPQALRASVRSELLHLAGEIEAVFLLWALPLLALLVWARGWEWTEHFVGELVPFTEPVFVVVILVIAGSRPVLEFAERAIGGVAALGGRTPLAWWLAILTVGPLLGSFITEPAAMVISAILLSLVFFDLGPSPALRYGTLGLLFANISVGGTLTHFAAPPVLMVASSWGWDTPFMLRQFGWKAALGIAGATLLYALLFRKEWPRLANLAERIRADAPREATTPFWIIAVHLALLAWTVFTAHTPPLFIGGFLFFLVFREATSPHQGPLDLRGPLLVGCFLAGLVIHGSLQGWWVSPILAVLGPTSLLFGAAGLTAVNDNAAITYLASQVPALTDAAKFAVVAGAVAGGGLTVLANAPNPAGQALLGRYFAGGISPLRLLAAALPPTLLFLLLFLLLG